MTLVHQQHIGARKRGKAEVTPSELCSRCLRALIEFGMIRDRMISPPIDLLPEYCLALVSDRAELSGRLMVQLVADR